MQSLLLTMNVYVRNLAYTYVYICICLYACEYLYGLVRSRRDRPREQGRGGRGSTGMTRKCGTRDLR